MLSEVLTQTEIVVRTQTCEIPAQYSRVCQAVELQPFRVGPTRSRGLHWPWRDGLWWHHFDHDLSALGTLPRPSLSESR
jgi:hypothetical protein